ncbi:hypothetical protein E1A91_A11G011700v1 [Gossypium mustelinum]|uniref:Citrate transporter-like domain-containing protein n=1 Tax=Gossypium mustelinum TaxID=34275 RepID=A0A5D2X3X5_GOSMU|nr:hypothetical protein E1A91_A11G011700v1 [Gossypium mustelinum]
MAMAAYVKLILGSVAFSIFWVLAVFPTVPLLPIGRAAGSLLGGILMVIFQILTVDQAYQAIDLSILVLLFGTMVVSGYLERADAFKYLGQQDSTVAFNGDGVDHQFSPATMSHVETTNVDSVHHESLRNRVNSKQAMGAAEVPWSLNGAYWDHRNQKLWKSCVYIVVVGMLVSLLMGFNMSGTAITAALALMILDFKDAVPCLEKVSYSLLIFFCGMFVTVQGFNKTGIPSALWELMEPYAKIDEISGIVVLALVILVLSNLVSNVPTVLLLGARMAASAALISTAYEKKAWLILAWVSTVAGNLSLLGSAASLIVCEQASRVPNLGYTLTFWNHLKFGVPSTLLVTGIGLLLLKS